MGEMPDDSKTPLVKRVPPPSVASPSELRPRDAGQVRWYKPTIEETLTLMGWRWVYFLPALAMIVSLFLIRWHIWLWQFMIVWWKLAVIAVVLPTGYAINTAKHIIRSRKEPFCIHCGYDLTGLPDNHTCPECGESYEFRIIEEYRRDPDWFIQRYQKHGEIPRADVPFQARRSTRKKSRDGT